MSLSFRIDGFLTMQFPWAVRRLSLTPCRSMHGALWGIAVSICRLKTVVGEKLGLNTWLSG